MLYSEKAAEFKDDATNATVHTEFSAKESLNNIQGIKRIIIYRKYEFD
jgi:hypothetical protein